MHSLLSTADSWTCLDGNVRVDTSHARYRELHERIADGYTLRHFTEFHSQRVPKHDAFNRALNRLTPDTLQAVNDAVIHASVDVGLEDGTRLRVDTTVVETDIHHPTDNTLLWDSVRVITRLVRQLDDRLPAGVGPFTNRTRAARYSRSSRLASRAPRSGTYATNHGDGTRGHGVGRRRMTFPSSWE